MEQLLVMIQQEVIKLQLIVQILLVQQILVNQMELLPLTKLLAIIRQQLMEKILHQIKQLDQMIPQALIVHKIQLQIIRMEL